MTPFKNLISLKMGAGGSGGGGSNFQTKSVSYTPSETQQTAQVKPDSGYDALSKVNVTVDAMPSGTAGTPSVTKGAVSNHSVSVTPSVTNTAGYISGGTISGTAVTVDVTELESGTKSITENGNGISVSGYSAVDVNVSGGGGYTDLQVLMGEVPSGNITLIPTEVLKSYVISGRENITDLTIDYPSSITSMNGNVIVHNPGLISLTIRGYSGSRTGNYHITDNANLENVYLDGFAGSIEANFLRKNAKLRIADLDEATGLSANVFYDDPVLQTVILRSQSICAIANNAFGNGPFSSGKSGGTIYIPKSLYDHLGDGTSLDYKAATNWSTYDAYGTITWAQIEGSIYE